LNLEDRKQRPDIASLFQESTKQNDRKNDILTRKVGTGTGLAKAIGACLRPKLRNANTFTNFLIVPLKAVKPVSFTFSKAHTLRGLEKIFFGEGPPRK
jgi:hypothetical protein